MARRYGAEVVWFPFDLHPEYPPEGIARAVLYARYGGDAHVAKLAETFARAGLPPYNPPPEVVPNTRDALRLTELARELGLHGAFHDRLMDAYWSEACDIGDHDELRRLAGETGLDPAEVEDVLAGDRFLGDVLASTRDAQSIGINGIPGFLLDRRLVLTGAYPLEVFDQAFAQLGIEPAA